MHLIDCEGEVIPCSYDQGTDCVVIKLYEYSDDLDLCWFVCDGEEYEILSWDLMKTTRRSAFLTLDIDDDDDSDELSDSESDSDYSDSDSESEAHEDDVDDDMPIEYGLPFQ